MNIQSTLQLIRFHKPIGTLLLWFPTAWALWLANHGAPSNALLIYFFVGTFLMRSAGCVINDIADRHVDQHVRRTASRPLVSRTISLPIALAILIFLLLAAFIILIQLPKICFYYALAGLFITSAYPFCKRFFEAPQLILGIAFSIGIPMAYAASTHALDQTTGYLMALNFFWIINYDTLYALSDRPDDLRIGIKSTAILFGKHWRCLILLLQGLTHSLWLLIAHIHHLSIFFYTLWSLGLFVFIYQDFLLQNPIETTYQRAFILNSVYGLIMWIALF